MRRKRRPRSVRCQECKQAIKLKKRGRIPSYCSATCKQQAYLKRKFRGLAEVVTQSIQTIKGRAYLRGEIWAILQETGLAPKSEPPPPVKSKRKPTSPLRLIK